jgi:CheY-like chemotaxis protein
MTALVRSATFGMKNSRHAPPLNAPKILLVDDNRNGLIVRKALLEEVGCAVSTACSGDEALGLFLAESFDLVVTDFRMPRMNGKELIERLRSDKPNVRVILLSGFVEPLGLTEATTGADLVLSKSSQEAPQLLRSVKRLLSKPARKPPQSQSARPHKRASQV